MVDQGATLFGGAVVTLALVLGVASAALGANGGNFILGKNNTATLLTKLTGTVDGAAMQVQNTNSGTNDTALDLRVQQGEAPMRVNSDARIQNLHADKVDGLNGFEIGPQAWASSRQTAPLGALLARLSRSDRSAPARNKSI